MFTFKYNKKKKHFQIFFFFFFSSSIFHFAAQPKKNKLNYSQNYANLIQICVAIENKNVDISRARQKANETKIETITTILKQDKRTHTNTHLYQKNEEKKLYFFHLTGERLVCKLSD